MVRPYTESHTAQWRVDVPVDVVWDYILDADAQVRHDPRVVEMALASGTWGEVGSVMAITGFGADTKLHTIQARLTAVERMRSYQTQEATADVTVTISVSTESHDGGTVVTTVTDIRTRNANWLERAVLRATRGKRRAESEFSARTGQRAIEEYAAARS